MKAHELLSSPDVWCQESPAEDAQGNKVQALNPKAVKWCALAAVQKFGEPSTGPMLRRTGRTGRPGRESNPLR